MLLKLGSRTYLSTKKMLAYLLSPAYETHHAYDKVMLFCIFSLISFGFIMVSSASMVEVSKESAAQSLHFAMRHAIYLAGCFTVSMTILSIPTQKWFDWSPKILLGVGLLLILVLLVGKTVNGATRWISFGPARIQIAELAKFAFTLYMSGYLVRRYQEVRQHAKGFYKPIILLFCYSALLLLQPDLGSVVVLFVIAVSLLFLAGAKLRDFFTLVFCGLFLIAGLAVFSPYRLRRMTTFMDPWQDPFGAGYQLTQSLMAYGRGGWFGEGLGNSIQKLKYLPEAHTDFIAAIIGEELGFIGVFCVLMVLFILATRAMHLGKECLLQQQHFSGYTAYGIGIWIFFQTIVNVGASMGLLPTKGLTLPFVSYGGSSLLIMTAAAMILVRIGYELGTTRNQRNQ